MNVDQDLIHANNASRFLQNINSADIMVGMPSYNNVVTASYVITQIVKGLETYFPNYKSVIFVADGGSKDSTLKSVRNVEIPSRNIDLIPTIYIGASGKGSALRAIFEAAKYLQVKSLALVDSDLRSITPQWMDLLISPTLKDTDFVAPLYNRRKYDGTITNFLCYPLTRCLFGKDIRQPIGGDFGLSIKLVNEILDSNLWSYTYVSRFGIDIFETYTALGSGLRIKEAVLGVKNHDPKDPSSQLAGMFRQVIGTMFTCIDKYKDVWKDICSISETEKVGNPDFDCSPEQIEVSFTNTIKAFKANFDNYVPFYRAVLSKNIQNKYEQLKKLEKEEVDLSSEIWVETVFRFLVEFKKEKDTRGELLLLDALRILWIGRVAAFMKDTWEQERDEAEAKIRAEAKVFAELKPLLLEKYH